MAHVLAGVLLFVAVCGAGLLLAFTAHWQMKRSGHSALPHTDPYVQYMQDKQSLNILGYAQQLRRSWNSFGSFSVSFTTMSLYAGAAVYFGAVFSYGGAWSFSIGWPIVSLFAMLVAAAMSEMASAIPTSGGGYHWAYAAGGKRWAWLTAWLRGLGDAGLLILVNWAAAYLIVTMISIRFNYERNTVSVLLFAFLLFAAQTIVARRGKVLLRLFMQFGAWLQVGLIVVIVVGLAVVIGPNLQPAEYLFSFGPYGTEKGGLVPVILTLLLLHRLFAGGDAAAHAVEETYNPKVTVPWSIYLTSVYGFVFGYVLLACIVLASPDIIGFHGDSNAFLALTTGVWGTWNPLMNNLILIGILCALWGSGLGCLNSASRLWFAYHRDARSGVNRWLAAVTPSRQLPHRIVVMVGLTCFTAFAALLYIDPWNGNYRQQLWFLTTWCILSFNLAYAIPIGLQMMSKRKSSRFKECFWHLGRLSPMVRLIAFLWLLMTSVASVLLMDAAALVVLGCILAVAGLTGLLNGRLRKCGAKPAAITSREELLRIERQYKQL
ncbi:amino acid permease [Paenibacillus tarimensis]